MKRTRSVASASHLQNMKQTRSLSALGRLRIRNMVLSAFFLALAYVLPFLTGQLKEIGSMLCPMHIPVLLCGFICGWQWGLTVGLIAPLFRSLTLGMPVFFPGAVCMALELAAYGAAAGLFYRFLPKKRSSVFAALLAAMLLGRLVWGCAMHVCMSINGAPFSLAAFFAAAFANAVPGILLQILLIPLLLIQLQRRGALSPDRFR